MSTERALRGTYLSTTAKESEGWEREGRKIVSFLEILSLVTHPSSLRCYLPERAGDDLDGRGTGEELGSTGSHR